MPSWSLCMIVKDEAAVLERCLDSVKTLVDEMIIVDTGSADGTKEIIKSYAGRLYEYDWQDDFSAARNYSFSLASSDYCLWLDADDVLPASTVETLEKLKENWDPATDVVMLPYQTAFDESGRPVFSFWRENIHGLFDCLQEWGFIVKYKQYNKYSSGLRAVMIQAVF